MLRKKTKAAQSNRKEKQKGSVRSQAPSGNQEIVLSTLRHHSNCTSKSSVRRDLKNLPLFLLVLLVIGSY